MTWDKNDNLICDWCFKIVIPSKEITKHDKEFNTGWTKCYECIEKATPFHKEGKIEDLPLDFFAPKDPQRKWLAALKME